MDEANLPGASRREARAGHEQLARRRSADLGEHEWRDDGRHDAELHLGEAELCLLFGEGDIAHGGQAGAASERSAMNSSDEWDGQAVERGEHP